MPAVPAWAPEWLSVPYYWIRIFWLAAIATWHLIFAKPLLSGIVALTIWLLTFLMHPALWGRQNLTDMRPAVTGAVALVLVLFVTFLVMLISTPARLYEEQHLTIDQAKRDNAELAWLRGRVTELARQLPPPALTSNQRTALVSALKNAGPHAVSIEYLDTPDSRAGAYAWALGDVFRSAVWHVEIRGVKPDVRGKYNGLLMNIEDLTHIRPTQKIVLDAFAQAGIPFSHLPGRNVADRVELIVGEM